MVREHGEERTASDPAWRLVVAPVKGTVAVEPHGPGDSLSPGDLVARVSSLRDTHQVISAYGGQVVEWLVEEGDPVSPGQPLLRLHPTGELA
jgi:[acyl-carrier-protein] S-malonyltransferase